MFWKAFCIAWNLFSYTNAGCGTCHPRTKFACANRNTVQLCNSNDELTESTVVCPDGYVCVSSSQYPCGNPQESEFDCQEKCSGVCPFPDPISGDTTILFICLGPNKYEICNDLGLSYPIISTCPDGQVCTANKMCAPSDANNLPVCYEGEVLTIAPTETVSTKEASSNQFTELSSTTTQTSTSTVEVTSSQALTPDQICEGKPNRSQYPLSPPDPFCKKYVFLRYIYKLVFNSFYEQICIMSTEIRNS